MRMRIDDCNADNASRSLHVADRWNSCCGLTLGLTGRPQTVHDDRSRFPAGPVDAGLGGIGVMLKAPACKGNNRETCDVPTKNGRPQDKGGCAEAADKR